MFRKLLVANRGEIACRVIATARRLGLRTVAVHSDADAGARHVAMADEAVHIGPSAAADSYLRHDRILDACRRTGAEAVHPGYGFLSENPGFVEAMEAAGLVFVGPPAAAIRAMGLKDAAKALMAEAGVPVVPGYHGADQDPARLAAEAAAIGYPVLIKARAGGGGKGMRLVEDAAGFQDALDAARREAEASFGDPNCLIEKFVTQPRHIEIQVFGDRHGNAIHLFERDCSLQRRHQKVIEEAPAPGMPEAVRAAMGRAAVEAARAIGYVGAGTVEFIVDGSGPLREDGFWFMEMNTRLQVEHPVSEAITGLDFVEMQLRVAAGEPLPIAQEDLAIDGWAVEARLYAEDVAKGFLPATGRLTHLALPDGAAFAPGPLRVDSGVRPGDAITPWYDPMIAKIIAHGPTRAAALARLSAALDASQVAGCVTNLAFLGALARHAGFARGEVDTGLIARDLEALTARPEASPLVYALAGLGALGLLAPPEDGAGPWDQLTGWRAWGSATHVATLLSGGDALELRLTLGPEGWHRAETPAGPVTLRATPRGGAAVAVEADGLTATAAVLVAPGEVTVVLDGAQHVFAVPSDLDGTEEGAAADGAVRAPMPGLVKLVRASAGAAVAKGDALVVMEAMKMELTLAAPRDGTVAELLVAAGDQVTDGALLLALEPEDG